MGECEYGVLVVEPKYRRPISKQQTRLLKLLYKFRFASTDLLAEIVERDRSTIYESLYVLAKQGYVYKRYDSSYRLKQLPASYTLDRRGIKLLLAADDGYANARRLHYFYRNKSASAEQVAHCLSVMAVFNRLRQVYGKQTFAYLSSSELANSPDFLRPLPDLCLERQRKHSAKPPLYIVEVADAHKPFWQHTKRLKAHQKHFEEHWNYDEYPVVLVVAADYRSERYLLKVIENQWFDFDVWVTNRARLGETTGQKLWATAFDQTEELTGL